MTVGIKILLLQMITLASQNLLENVWLWSMGFFTFLSIHFLLSQMCDIQSQTENLPKA